jgi:glycosyltransferase involved in cell wall biosynthesis
MQGSLVDELRAHGFLRSRGALVGMVRRLERRICGFFPVVAQSDTLVEFLSTLGVSGQRCLNAGDGVDTTCFYPRPFPTVLGEQLGIDAHRPRIVYLGLLEKYQGVDVMLEAVTKTRELIPDVLLIVVGYPNVERYRRLAHTYGIGNNVIFVGKVAYEDTPDYLALADVALAPKLSASEGNGKVYNYMAMGLIVIAFDNETTVEILADCGVYAPLGDAGRLATRIVEVLGQVRVFGSLGTRARRRAVRELSWDAVGRRIEEFYGRHGAVTSRRHGDGRGRWAEEQVESDGVS